jgi:uncharacterized membrane protein
MSKTRVCDACGETKPVKDFLTRTRRLDKTCTACRAKERRKLRYEKDRASDLQVEMREAIKEQKGVLDSMSSAMITEVRKLMSMARYKLKTYDERIAQGKFTEKTLEARARQAQRVRYYNHVINIITTDARRGQRKPLLYYLSNTKLLEHHGFLCQVIEADPDLVAEHGEDDGG